MAGWYDRKNRYAHQCDVRALHSIPTQQQIKYYNFLLEKCKEYDLKPELVNSEHRNEYKRRISQMVNALKAINADFHWEHKRRFKFDKNGNTVDISTGKIVKKAGDRT